jgi:hypothetical protein
LGREEERGRDAALLQVDDLVDELVTIVDLPQAYMRTWWSSSGWKVSTLPDIVLKSSSAIARVPVEW